MLLRRRTLSSVLVLATLSVVLAQQPIDPNALVEKIQGELSGAVPPDNGKPDANVPHGAFLHGTITDSKIHPGTENTFEAATTLPSVMLNVPVVFSVGAVDGL